MQQYLASASFVRALHRALHHLYDPAELSKNPLVELLGVDQRDDPALALRRLLLAAIAALKPGPDVPPQAPAWRVYQILAQRYGEQCSQREVATDLSLSIRQLRRYQTNALRVLAEYLWARYDVQAKTADGGLSPQASEEIRPAGKGGPSREQELEWLRRSFPSEATEVSRLIEVVLRTAMPLAQASAVRIECSPPADLPSLTAQQATLRQALLNALTVAIRCAAGGTVSLTARASEDNVCIHIRSAAAPAPLSADDGERLQMARQLVELAGGSLILPAGGENGGAFQAELTLPAVRPVTVLAVDDNADDLGLLQRYLDGTRYRFTGTSDPEQMLAEREEPAPDIILLDVMLPGVDGWELLGRLREHPRTQGVPIVVCTILPQEQLALALGAAAFIRKPVSRKGLLAVLDRLLQVGGG